MSQSTALPPEPLSSCAVVLVGDSDIERWPRDLVPTTSNGDARIRGQSGATMEEVLPLMKLELEEASQIQSLSIVFCAGENDISQNIRLDETLISFRKLLDMIFPLQGKTPASTTKRHLIVLGPKFEPWLEYDTSCRKQYFKLSNAMERACKKHPSSIAYKNNDKIAFLDCLTMFCGDSAQQPGSRLGGKAMPETKYFDHDLLHLSREGYQIWKEVISQHLDA